MTNKGWLYRLSNQQPFLAGVQRIAGGTGVALSLMLTGIAAAQNPAPANPLPGPETKMSVPNGYVIHQSVDLGGRIAYTVGSQAMYDNLVNLQSGPRVQNETFQMRVLPGQKGTLVDSISAVGNGFGGDPVNFVRLNASRGRIYEFSGMFRRDRRYFDYDLLGNPNIPGGQSIPIGPSNAPTGSFAWPQTLQSPFMFNTVRRMTDVGVVLMPLSTLSYRIAYAKNLMQGPSLSPSGYQFAKYNAVLEEYPRNNTDDITAGVDWKPVRGTMVSYEEQITHFKGDSYFTLSPNSLIAQEADGTRVAINDFDSLSPYGISACNTASMGSAYTPAAGANPAVYTILTPSTTPGGLPVINPACAVVTSYLRSQATRSIFPTEVLRLQSASIKNLSINGNVRFTDANMHLPNYSDSYQGLNGATRSLTFTGNANAKRQVLAADLGGVWQTTSNFSVGDQISFSSMHQPGTTTMTSGTTLATPALATGNATINYPTLTTTSAAAGASTFEGSPAVGASGAGFTGQLYITNNLTGAWDVSSRATLSLTYRYQNHVVAEGDPHNIPLPVGASIGGTVTINENAGVLTAALRPTANLSVNGSVEFAYADNALTPVSPRQLRHYRIHARYKPRPWATLSGAFNDLERHNNTNNNQAAVTAGDDPYEGPLDHVDHTRIGSLSGLIMPNEHYGLDFSYAYTDVYAATNICFDNGAQNASTKPSAYPGTATLTASGAPDVCPGAFTRGSTTQLADWFGRDFMDAPTQYGSVALRWAPTKPINSNFGYRISSVNGTRFFNDARDVNGSLVSTYESPFLNLAWTMRPGLIWKAEYNYYGYGEGGPSGPQNCSFSTSLTSTVVPCASLPEPTGLTESPSGLTAPRNFHANNLTLGVHYEF
ncbi:MAG: hypothetical protein ABSC76_09480 [Terracidiphilus sp.]